MSSTATAPLERTLVLPPTDDLAALSHAELKQRIERFAAIRRLVDARTARLSAEIARRSTRELGYDGLAQSHSVRSPEQLVEKLTGVPLSEARALVRVGELIEHDTGLPAVAEAVAAGDISIHAADAISSGLGEPSEAVGTETLAAAAELLVDLAPDTPVRRLAVRARELRDGLDAAGVADRERLMRDRRSVRTHHRTDGMLRLVGLFDPESAAIITAAFDQVTSPRRGGPRFIDPDDQARAQRIIDDPRTTEQLLADALVDMVRIAGAADPGTVFAQRRPAVIVHVDHRDLETGEGAAHIEGQTAAVSINTVKRLACSYGAEFVLFDGSRPLELGRSTRRYTDAQRTALAARDGGCPWGDCDRPPSWTEAHHIDEWAEGGHTNVSTGILLCRFHHLLVHNQGWKIRVQGSELVAIPPPHLGRPPVILRSRNPVHQRAVARRNA